MEGKLFLKVSKVNTKDFSKWLLNSLMQVKMSEWVLVILPLSWHSFCHNIWK